MNSNFTQTSPDILAVINLEPGGGKTTTVVNLAIALAAAGRSILVIDLDPKGAASRALLTKQPEYGGSGQLLLTGMLTPTMLSTTAIPNLQIAPAGDDLESIASELSTLVDGRTRLMQALNSQSTLNSTTLEFQHVIIDCPSTLEILTQNAIQAAQRILLPALCNPTILEFLPAQLNSLAPELAQVNHPITDPLLLLTKTDSNELSHTVSTTVRQEYGQLTLMTEIPLDAAIIAAIEQAQPVLLAQPRCLASQAYLTLAAEWLTMLEGQPSKINTLTQFQTRQENIENFRRVMVEEITTWFQDPSSLIYDPDWETRFAPNQLSNNLINQNIALTKDQPSSWRAGVVVVVAFIIIMLTTGVWFIVAPSAADWRLAVGLKLLDPAQAWQAGSMLLANSDQNAYRELLYAAQLIEHNRQSLILCGEQARTLRDTTCMIEVPTP